MNKSEPNTDRAVAQVSADGRVWPAPLLAVAAMTAMTALAACSSSSGSSSPGEGGNGNGDADTYTVGGEVNGISDGSLALVLNDDETLELDSDGAFSFDTKLEAGENYSVTVAAHPGAHQLCELEDASGAIDDADVTNIAADCDALSMRITNRESAIELDWEREEAVTIHYSSDYHCDWSNPALCDDSGMVVDVTGGATTLSVEEDGLTTNQAYTFVKEIDGQISPPMVGTAMSFQLNNPVHASLITQDRVIAGGESRYYGAKATSVAEFRTDTEHAEQTGALINLEDGSSFTVNSTVARAPDGGLFMAGSFEQANGEPRTNIVRLHPDGSVDESWTAELNGLVLDLLVHEDRLYASGGFGIVNGQGGHNGLVALTMDGDIDSDFILSSTPNGRVHNLVMDGDTLYFSGLHTEHGVNQNNFITAVDAATGEDRQGFDVTLENNVSSWGVQDFIIDGDHIVIAGAFETVDGVAQNYLALIDKADGSLVTGFTPNINGTKLWNVSRVGDRYLITGEFDDVDGHGSANVALLHASDGSPDTDWNAAINGDIYDADIHDGFVYIAGLIRDDGMDTISGFRRLHLSDGSTDEQWQPKLDGLEYGWEVYLEGDSVMLSGTFRGAGGHTVDHLAAFDLATGELDSDFQAGTDGPVHALALRDGTLYTGGNFQHAIRGEATQERAHAAAFDLDTQDITAWAPETNDTVRSIDLNDAGDVVYIAGDFDTARGLTREGLAAVDASIGDATGASENPEVQERIHSVSFEELDGDNGLVLAGAFGEVNTHTYGGFAYADRDSLYIDPNQHPAQNNLQANGTLHDVAYLSVISMFWAGDFTEVADQPQENFAIIGWDNTENEYVVDGPNVSHPVYSVLFDNNSDTVLIGGAFDDVGGEARAHFAAIDLGSGYTVRIGTPEFSGPVHTLSRSATHVAVGGDFDQVDGERHGGIILLDLDTLEAAW